MKIYNEVARNVSILSETEKAWLVRFKGGQTGWIPRSLFKVVYTKVNSLTGFKTYTIVIPKWLEKSIYKKYNEYKKSKTS